MKKIDRKTVFAAAFVLTVTMYLTVDVFYVWTKVQDTAPLFGHIWRPFEEA